jgi:serine/threonine protein kinase
MEIIEVKDINAQQPTLVDNYVAEKELGRGSFGVVYLARNINTGERVVIKQLKRITGEEKVEYDNLFSLREQCNKYFVCVKEYIDKGNTIYIVMEYLENFYPLSAFMGKIKVSFEQNVNLNLVNTIIRNICMAIKYMYKRGIAHNDIKPENMMLNETTGEIRFIDFGLSCKKEKCALGPGSRASGTPYYMDPVQFNKIMKGQYVSPEERSSADIWAFGIMIYEMIMGDKPMHAIYNNKGTEYMSTYDFLKDPNRNYINTQLAKLPEPFVLDTLLNNNISQRKLPC